MAKAKTTRKSKPAKKTAHKIFHKHAAEEPVTPSPESAPQTIQAVSKTVIPPVIQSEPKPVPEVAPTSPQPQQPTEESIAPAPVITPPSPADTTPSVVNDTPITGDTENTAVDTNKPSQTMTPEEQRKAEPQLTSPINDQEESKSKKPIIIVAIIIILIALASSYFLYSKKLKSASQKPQSQPANQTTQSSPEPSPQTLNKADWTLEILNGSTKKGAAAALAEKLSAKGYQVIKTGNAEEDIATSEVFFANSIKNQTDLFLEDIKEDLPNPTNTGTLNDSTASARIIIGEE